MSYQINIHNTVESLKSELWQVLKDELPVSMDPDYLKLLERLHRGQLDFHYACVRKDGDLVGFIYFQTITFKGSYLTNFIRTDENSGLLKKLLFGFIGFILNFLSWKLLLTGNIFFTGERGVYFIDDFPEEDAADLIHEAFNMVRKKSEKRIDAYMLNNVYDDDVPFVHRYLNKFKYATYPVDPDMFMKFDPKWTTFDEYLGSLSSKYRVRLKKVLKASEPVETKILSSAEMEAYKDKIHELYMSTAENVDFNLGYLDQHYFCEMKKLWGENFRCITYFVDDKLIGFMSLLIVNSDIDVNYMGMDYDYNRQYKLYNRMLTDLVNIGIDMKTKTMHLGRTATEIKSTVGAKAKGMKIYLSSPSGWRAKGMRYFEPYFGSPEYTLRHPFKGAEA